MFFLVTYRSVHRFYEQPFYEQASTGFRFTNDDVGAQKKGFPMSGGYPYNTTTTTLLVVVLPEEKKASLYVID